ncbi:uncharacterized protein LOC133129585 [Conger conger]|uniref:uncharacterized protein LOC133129585 n=1 Tax=Conger conger TaxID=82655 RepID=UPI002A5ADF11|nr:uncharacterized protein LOC133129585 [Conger conger]
MMERLSIAESEFGEPSLPVSSLHLLVPPLHLLSAAMWQILQQQDMLHYGKLEEFVSLVMETFPELLSESQRTELTLGLQTVCWLSAAPSVLEVCVQTVLYTDQLKTLLRHHRSIGQLDMNVAATLPSIEECKLSSISHPPSQRMVDFTKLTNTNSQSKFATDCMTCSSPNSPGEDKKAESMLDSSDFTEVEPRSSLNRCDYIEERTNGYLMSRGQKDILTNMKEEVEDGERQSVKMETVNDVKGEEELSKEEDKKQDEQRDGHITYQVGQTDKLQMNGLKSEHGHQDGEELSTLVTSCLLKQPRVLIHRVEIANCSVSVSSLLPPVASKRGQGVMCPWRCHEILSRRGNGSLTQDGQVVTWKRKTQLKKPVASENGICAEASLISPAISPRNKNTEPSLPVSSLHLLVPPLQLLSAAMWQILQQQDMLHYGKLEEFVSLVMETFPELLSDSQRTELTLGLQDSGSKTDPALEDLLWDLLYRLHQLLPVPDLKQTVSWLSDAPSVLEICVQSISYTNQLKTLLRHHRSLGQLEMNKECKLSSMSCPPSQRVVDTTKRTITYSQSVSILNQCVNFSGDTIKSEYVTDSSDYAETSNIQTDKKEEEDTERRSVKIEGDDGVRDEEGLWKNEEKERDEQRDGHITYQVGQTDKLQMNGVKSEHGHQEVEDLSTLVTSCLLKQPRVLIHPVEIANCSVSVSSLLPPVASKRGQDVMCPGRCHEISSERGSGSLKQKGQVVTRKRKTQLKKPVASENGICAEASLISPAISPRNKNTGQTVEMSSQDFACSQCPFIHTEEVNLHQHIEKVHPEEPSRTVGSQQPPSSTHQHPTPPKTLPTSTQSHRGTPGAHTGKGFSSLKKHQQPHPGKHRYQCSQCGKGFSRPSVMKQHQRTHTGERPYQCSQCGKSFTRLSHLKQHQITHTGERPYQCSQCGKSFSRLDHLKQHQITHTRVHTYLCAHCGKRFFQSSDLKQHQITHAGERRYKCSQCGKGFFQSSTLNRHQRTHSGERRYQCSQCGKGFFQSSTLKGHQRTHTGEHTYHCSQCGKSFSQVGQLRQHYRTHTGERPYECSQCGKSFSQVGQLKQHQQVRTGEFLFHCSQCGKRFSQSCLLKIHQQTHTEEHLYQCSQCGKDFSQSNDLKRHWRTHTGERPYHCSQCGKSFTQLSYWKQHQITHTGERPYHCSQCGMSFNRLYHLNLHLVTHTGEHPYQLMQANAPKCLYHCSQCRKSFTQSGTLMKHQRIHTRESQSCS